MFGAKSWRSLPKWKYLMHYKDQNRFQVKVNRSTLPAMIQRYNNWEQYKHVKQILFETKLPVEVVPDYVFNALSWTLKEHITDYSKDFKDYDKLYDHQKIGVTWAVEDFKGVCLFADDMGMGKTLQATATAVILLKNQLKRNILFGEVLILCPAYLQKQWKDITAKYLEGLAKITVLSYDTAKNKADELKKIKYSLFIGDEIHLLKDPRSIRYRKLSKIIKKIKFRILISGTPVVNRSNELFSPLSLLKPKLFKSNRAFCDRYYCKISRKARAEEELALILPYFGMIRRTKEKLNNLPAKNITKLYIDDKNSKLEFKRLAKTLSELDKEENAGNMAKFHIGNAYYKLGMTKSKSKNLKREVLKLCTENITEWGASKVIFCYHMSVIEALQQWIEEKGISYDVINGHVSVKKRTDIIKRFQNSEFDIIICTIGAAGVGVTLTNSHHVIMVETSWVPGLTCQAIDRVHRIGQTNKVQVHRIIFKETLDDWIIKCENGKKKLHKTLLKQAKHLRS